MVSFMFSLILFSSSFWSAILFLCFCRNIWRSSSAPSETVREQQSESESEVRMECRCSILSLDSCSWDCSVRISASDISSFQSDMSISFIFREMLSSFRSFCCRWSFLLMYSFELLSCLRAAASHSETSNCFLSLSIVVSLLCLLATSISNFCSISLSMYLARV